MKEKYRGVVVPMITPFHEDRSIDEPSAVRICEFLLKRGMSIFLLGTTGEALSMPMEMRFQFVHRVMKALPNPGTVYVGISDHALDHAIEAAKRFFDSGANVSVAHLPSYYPLTSDAMLAYYEMLADGIPGPLMLYNVPGTTQLSIPLEVVEKLSHHPNIIGLKDSERDVNRLQTLMDLQPRQEREVAAIQLQQAAQCISLTCSCPRQEPLGIAHSFRSHRCRL